VIATSRQGALATGALAVVVSLAGVLVRTAPSVPVQRASTDVVRVGILKPGGGYAVVSLPLELYVARVVAGEGAQGSQPAALEALAITVRTYALANLGRHRADGFDLCDQTHCQVMRQATAATERAAAATAGRALLRDRFVPASIYYTASCGGRTEIPSDVWPGAEDPPFLPSRKDEACGGTPAWSDVLSTTDLLRALHAAGFRGDRLSLRIVSRNASGRVSRLRLDGLKPDEISGQDFRVALGRTLGWQHVKSTAFDLARVDQSYRFAGHGSGHGVGLCVIGSARLADGGLGAAEILRRYFPGLEIGSPGASLTAAVPPTVTPHEASSPTVPQGVILSLPDEDEGERSRITMLIASARDELAHELSVPAPGRVMVRVHPTAGSYERATGRAWFTSGAVVNGDVHMLPLVALRDRGVLERTIRHELVHLMIDAELGRRPLWVREGAAIYFAGERPIPGVHEARATTLPPRAACPDAQELEQPVSIGALSNAYARARACFSRQIAQGRSWREVK